MIKKVPEDWQRNQKMSMPHIHERQHFVIQLQPDPNGTELRHVWDDNEHDFRVSFR